MTVCLCVFQLICSYLFYPCHNVGMTVCLCVFQLICSYLFYPCHNVGMTVCLCVFQLICSYLFYPLSFLMGVDADDRLKMGELIGTKTFLNEFYAYTELSVYINNRKTLNEYVHTSIVLQRLVR